MPSATRRPTNAVAKITETTATASPRGSRSCVRSRTSGLSVNAITDGREEEEEDVAERAREQEREQQEHREPDELDPARDPDRRRLGHGAIVALPRRAGSRREPGLPSAVPCGDGFAALPASGASP